jgi:hypothetical protein
VIFHNEPSVLRYLTLALFDRTVAELKHLSAANTNHMIVMPAMVDLKHRTTTFKVMTADETGRFELGKHTVDRGKTYFLTHAQQPLVDILSGQMWVFRVL